MAENSSMAIFKDRSRLEDLCQLCGEGMYQESNGLIVPRSCFCMRQEQERYEKQIQVDQERARNVRINRMFEGSRLTKHFKAKTFENYRPKYNPVAYKTCKNYSKNFSLHKNTGYGMILVGGVGTGKTHLSAAITNELLRAEYSVIFGTMIDLLDRLRESYDSFSGGMEYSGKELLNALKTTDLLVIDDIGKEKINGWVMEKIYGIIDARYNNDLPILLTSNDPLEKLCDHIGEACVDRLVEMCDVIPFIGASYRKAVAKHRNSKETKQNDVIN